MAAKSSVDEVVLEKSLPEVTGYDSQVRFYATRYKQGGRTVYSLDLSLLEVKDLIPRPDPEKLTPGNRSIRPKHAADFATYLRTRPDWVAPSIILRSSSIFSFKKAAEIEGVEFGVLSFGRLDSIGIQILDGQHRILGIYLALDGINEGLERARSNKANARRLGDEIAEAAADESIRTLRDQQNRLARERVNVQIHIVEDPVAYKQMFFDIADNALGITASVKSRFDNRKVVNRSLDIVIEHPLLLDKVDPERDRLQRGSPYLITVKHVAEIVRSVITGIDGRVGRRQEAELNEKDVAASAKSFLDVIVQAFPDLQSIADGTMPPGALRQNSLLGSALMVRILAGVYHELVMTDRAWDQALVVEFFAKLAPHMDGPVYDGSIWTERTPYFTPGEMAPHSRRQDIKGLTDTLVDWAIIKPKFLDKKPAPRPKSVEELEREEAIAAGFPELPAKTA